MKRKQRFIVEIPGQYAVPEAWEPIRLLGTLPDKEEAEKTIYVCLCEERGE